MILVLHKHISLIDNDKKTNVIHIFFVVYFCRILEVWYVRSFNLRRIVRLKSTTIILSHQKCSKLTLVTRLPVQLWEISWAITSASDLSPACRDDRKHFKSRWNTCYPKAMVLTCWNGLIIVTPERTTFYFHPVTVHM